MPRHSEVVVLQDGTEVRREVKAQDGVLFITYDNTIYIVENAGKYALEANGEFIATRSYFRVVRKAVIS